MLTLAASLSDAIWPAVISAAAIAIAGIAKALLDSKKVKADASIASFSGLEKRNEFLEGQVNQLRKENDATHSLWSERYEKMRTKYDAEREKSIRLETRHEFRSAIRHNPELPDTMEHDLDYMEVFGEVIDAVVFTNDTGNMIGANDPALQLFGYTGNQMVGQSLAMLMPATYYSMFKAAVDRVHSGIESCRKMQARTIAVMAKKSDNHEFACQCELRTFQIQQRCFFAVIFKQPEQLELPP